MRHSKRVRPRVEILESRALLTTIGSATGGAGAGKILADDEGPKELVLLSLADRGGPKEDALLSSAAGSVHGLGVREAHPNFGSQFGPLYS